MFDQCEKSLNGFFNWHRICMHETLVLMNQIVKELIEVQIFLLDLELNI